MTTLLASTGCAAIIVAGALESDRTTQGSNAKRQATYRSFGENEGVLLTARDELKIQRTCKPSANTACGVLSEGSWSRCDAPSCQSAECQSRWVSALAASLGRRYFAANHRRLRKDCDATLARCARAEALEQSFFTSHNLSVDQFIDKKRELNRQFFDAGDPAAMNAFSAKLNEELAGWRAAVKSTPECPRPPQDAATPQTSASTAPPAASSGPSVEDGPILACKVATSDGHPAMMFRKPDDFRLLLVSTQSGASKQNVANGFVERGGVKIEPETPCAVLERQGTLVRVRITQGPWEGTQGWVRADQVSIDGE